jgi:hypothetical protein
MSRNRAWSRRPIVVLAAFVLGSSLANDFDEELISREEAHEP